MTYDLLLLARLGLAATFAVAGLAKLADPAGTTQAVARFGIPARWTRPVAAALPVVELGVAASLLPVGWARLGAGAAVALLAAFSAAVVVNLRRGNTPECHCFGQLRSRPIGWPTVVRNGMLAAVGVAILAAGPGTSLSGPWAWMGGRSAVERAVLAGFPILGVLVVALLRLVFGLLAQQGRLLLRVDALEALLGEHDGVPVGDFAPGFTLPRLGGGTLGLTGLLAGGRPVLLVFTDPQCAPCHELLPELARWQRDHRDVVTIAVISRGDPELHRANVAGSHLEDVLLQRHQEVARAYRTTATPSAVLVGPDGRVRSPVAAGADAIWRLLLRRPYALALRPPAGEAKARSIGQAAVLEELGS